MAGFELVSRKGRQPPREPDILRTNLLVNALESAAECVVITDASNHILYVNRSFVETYGFARQELSGRHISLVRAPESPVPPVEEIFAGTLKGGWRGELINRRKDGSVFPIHLSTSVVRDKRREPVALIGIAQDITQRQRSEEELRASRAALRSSQEELRALTAGLLAAQEEERRRVSRELHDDLNQKLAMLAIDVEVLEQQMALSPEPLRDQLRSLKNRVVGLSDDVRRMAYQLHPWVLEHLGLDVALRTYCAEFSKREGIKVRFVHSQLLEPPPPDVAFCLYRVVQEGLRNVARHSGSTRATVTLRATRGSIHLSVSDFGAGFDPGLVKRKGGLGFISMEERVRLVRGAFSVKSCPGGGTRIAVRVPLPKASALSASA